jgi:hypothetical protein
MRYEDMSAVLSLEEAVRSGLQIGIFDGVEVF